MKIQDLVYDKYCWWLLLLFIILFSFIELHFINVHDHPFEKICTFEFEYEKFDFWR